MNTPSDPIQNCELAFSCSKTWGSLIETDEQGKKFCDSCGHHVYNVTSADDLEKFSALRHCVAIEWLATAGLPALPDYDGEYYDLVLSPVTKLTFPQMKELKDMLRLQLNYIEIRNRFCDNNEHTLFEELENDVCDRIGTRLKNVNLQYRVVQKNQKADK